MLDYVAAYPKYGITYCARDMVLCGNSDATYINKTKYHSYAGAYIFLLEYNSVPQLNGPVLTVDQIIKNFISSAAEAELAGLFITDKSMSLMQQNIIEMGWP